MSQRDIDPYRIARQLRACAADFESIGSVTSPDPEVDAALAIYRAAIPLIAAGLRHRAALLTEKAY